MMKGSTHHGLIMASALNNKLRDTWSPNWQRARQDSGQLPRSHMKPGHQPCPAWGRFSGRFSLFLSVPWSLHPGSLQAGRCIPASPYPLEPGGVASPSLAPALGMREGAASRTSAPAIRAAPEPAGPCALRVSERCPSLEAGPLPHLLPLLRSTFSGRPPLTLCLLPLLYSFHAPYPYKRP